MRTRTHPYRRDWIARILLALLVFGAYVPVGYMPADGAPFRVELCPAASPMGMSLPAAMPSGMAMHMHHHHGTGTHVHFDDCPFGSTPAAGPPAQVVAFAPPAPVIPFPTAAFDTARRGLRPLRAHQPRGPPSPA